MKSKSSKDYIYYAFLILYVIFIVGYLLYKYVFSNIFVISECVIYKIFGVYCPGCGGTRAMLAFLRGDLLISLYYNPIVICFFIITSLYIILNTLARILKKDSLKILFYKQFGYIMIIVLILNCVIKNFLLLKYGIKM